MIPDKAVKAVVKDTRHWDDECSLPWFPEGGAEAAVRHMLEVAEPHLGVDKKPAPAKEPVQPDAPASNEASGADGWSCEHCGDPIDNGEDDLEWRSQASFGSIGASADAEALWCPESADHKHSPDYAEPDLCHNGHPFEPGVDTDMATEGRQPDPRWCNVCGEARRCAPGVSEAAVDAAERAYGAFGAGMVDALEAAAPLLGARPLLDRAAVGQALRSNLTVNEYNEPSATGTTAAVDAVMELARPMPTREQIDALLLEWRVRPPGQPTQQEAINYRRKMRNAVLALINGSKP